MLHDDNDHFWKMYNEEHDYEYFKEHEDDYSGRGRIQHPVYWLLAWAFIIFVAGASDDPIAWVKVLAVAVVVSLFLPRR